MQRKLQKQKLQKFDVIVEIQKQDDETIEENCSELAVKTVVEVESRKKQKHK